MISDKKAQLSMFFLIGILIVAVFAAIWYINSRSAELQLQAPTEKLITDLLKTGAVPYYVGLCLDRQAGEALDYVGKQGGDIFLDQYGIAPNPSRSLTLGYGEDVNRITYGISAPPLVENTTYPFPPGYPGGEGANAQVPELRFDKTGLFGHRTLRRLCDTNGSNSPFVFNESRWSTYSAEDNKTYKNVITDPICMYDNYDDYLSIQYQMESYVENTLLNNCTNWTAIQMETGYNISPTGESVDVVFRLGLDDVWVDAYIPIVISVTGGEPVYTVADFHTRFDVRLKKLVEFATLVAKYDSYYLAWNMSFEYEQLYNWDTHISLLADAPYKPASWDDIITVMDMGSVLFGKPYIYRFVRENRYPALDYIHENSGVDDIDWGSDYDIVVMEYHNITITPNPMTDTGAIYDPDEDNLTYYYTGWRSTCLDAPFDGVGTPDTAGCSGLEPSASPSMYFDFPNKGASLNDSYWSSSSIQSSELLNWTSSRPYLLSGRNASYMPNDQELGPHNVTVWVCDEAGLCDYQVVRILVLGYPEVYLNGTNYFAPQIPYNHASVEDFYVLNGEGSTPNSPYYSPILGYIFSDDVEPFEIEVDNWVVDLPQPNPSSARHIYKIPEYNFSRDALCVKDEWGHCTDDYYNALNHTINLSLKGYDIPPATMNVTVHQCLPYYDAKFPFPWPYNKTKDAFQMSHSCCSPGKAISFDVVYGSGGDVYLFPQVHFWIVLNTFYGGDLGLIVVQNSTGAVVGLSHGDFTFLQNAMMCLSLVSSSPLIPVFPFDDSSSDDTQLIINPGMSSVSWSGPSTTFAADPPDFSSIGVIGPDDSSDPEPADTPLLDALDIPYPICITSPGDQYVSLFFNGMSFDIGGNTYAQEGVPPGLYKVTLFSKLSADIPRWGTWFDDDHVCYGGQAKVGVMEMMEESFDDVDISFPLEDPNKIYSPASMGYENMVNDVVLMDFVRKCSGDRGNVCTGEADVTYTSMHSCSDLSGTEIERCMGPDLTYKSIDDGYYVAMPCSSDADCSSCDYCSGVCDDSGYCLPADGCKPFSAGNSFEKEFNVLRTAGDYGEADGTCNPIATCSDDADVYSPGTSSGQFLIPGAHCNGADGTCSVAKDEIDCAMFDGYTDMSASTHICMYGNAAVAEHLFTSSFLCNNPGPGLANCAMSALGSDPDSSKTACLACHDPATAAYATGSGSGIYVEDRTPAIPSPFTHVRDCCGDDIGEGGFPYGAVSSTFNYSRSGSSAKGQYFTTEKVCDDYFGGLLDNDDWLHWIDNDCDALANCMDSDCWGLGKRGPIGSYCCNALATTHNLCIAQLDPIGTGVDCGANYECDCLRITSGPGSSFADPLPGDTTINTCMNEYDGPNPNRVFNISSLSETQFIFTVEDLDGGSDCELDLSEMWFYDSSFSQLGDEKTASSSTQRIPSGATLFALVNNNLDDDCLVNIEFI